MITQFAIASRTGRTVRFWIRRNWNNDTKSFDYRYFHAYITGVDGYKCKVLAIEISLEGYEKALNYFQKQNSLNIPVAELN